MWWVDADLGRQVCANQGWRLPVAPSHAWRGATDLAGAVDPRPAWMCWVDADLGRQVCANQGWRLPVAPSHAWRGATDLAGAVDSGPAWMCWVDADLGRQVCANQGWRLPVSPGHAWRGSTDLAGAVDSGPAWMCWVDADLGRHARQPRLATTGKPQPRMAWRYCAATCGSRAAALHARRPNTARPRKNTYSAAVTCSDLKR